MFISDVTSQYAYVTPTLPRHIFYVTQSVMDGCSTTSVLRQFIFKIKKFGDYPIKSHFLSFRVFATFLWPKSLYIG